ncbi:MAG: PQQ-binding-like beta-propeller repeat protein [Anaerolineaceae bacterium]|nr:PQQ-binding-like beta-propeller repeat protein [Anaerolineaceae bacterium]
MNKKCCFLLLLVVLVLFSVSCVLNENTVIETVPLHDLENNYEFQIVWDRLEEYNYKIIGGSGRVIIHGRVNDASLYKLIALDSSTGNTVWTKSNTIGDVIIRQDVLYQGTADIAYVKAFRLIDGDLIWDTRLPWAHSVNMISTEDNQILIHTTDSQCFVLNINGEILTQFKETFKVFLKKDNILYMLNGFGIEAMDFSSKEKIWELEVSRYFSVPVFSDGTLFLKTHTKNGYILAVNPKTGDVNWKVDQNVLSNLYVTDTKLYFVNKDSELVVLDKTTGDEISITKFTPTFDLDIQNEEYYITGDPTNNILAISFGDNNQIIGLKILNP